MAWPYTSAAVLTDFLPADWSTMVLFFYTVAAALFLWLSHYALLRPLNRIRVR